MGIESWLARPANARAATSDLDHARLLFAQRRARDGAAGDDLALFSEPAWDLMLALFIAYEEDRCVAPDAIGSSIALSPAITDRWVATLATRGLVIVIRRQSDRYVSLTDAGVAFMLRCLQAR